MTFEDYVGLFIICDSGSNLSKLSTDLESFIALSDVSLDGYMSVWRAFEVYCS